MNDQSDGFKDYILDGIDCMLKSAMQSQQVDRTNTLIDVYKMVQQSEVNFYESKTRGRE